MVAVRRFVDLSVETFQTSWKITTSVTRAEEKFPPAASFSSLCFQGHWIETMPENACWRPPKKSTAPENISRNLTILNLDLRLLISIVCPYLLHQLMYCQLMWFNECRWQTVGQGWLRVLHWYPLVMSSYPFWGFYMALVPTLTPKPWCLFDFFLGSSCYAWFCLNPSKNPLTLDQLS